MLEQEPITLRAQDGVEVSTLLHHDPKAPKTTAVMIMHPTTDWQQHYILPLLAERGIGALGFRPRYAGREAELILEETLLDTAAAVKLLRDRGYANVLAIGNSGGGEIMAGYQAEAEHPSIISGSLGKGSSFTQADLPPLNGLIMLNAHRGRPHSLTRGLDPSVGGQNGNDPFDYDPGLDMYNERNGPPYASEFIERYSAAQVERNHKITRWAQDKLARLSTLGNPHLTDVPFIVYRTDANLSFADRSIEPTDRSGKTIWGEDPRVANYTAGALRGASTRLRVFTLRSWISQRGLSTSQFDMLQFLPRCHVPVLFLVGTAEEGTLPSEAQEMFEAAPDPMKRYTSIKGGTHFMRGQPEQQADAADAIRDFTLQRNLG